MSLDLFGAIFLVACLVGTVSAYGIRARLRGRARFERIESQQGSALLGKWLLEAVYWSLQPLGGYLHQAGVSANQVTWASLLLAAAAGVSFALGKFGIGTLICALASILDAVDGMLARLERKTTRSGELLDSSVDRYSEFFLIGGLAHHYRADPWSLLFALLALTGGYMISYSTAKAEIFKVTAPRSPMRRPERAFLLTMGALFNTILPSSRPAPAVLALGLIGLVAHVSAIHRLKQIAQAAPARVPAKEKAV